MQKNNVFKGDYEYMSDYNSTSYVNSNSIVPNTLYHYSVKYRNQLIEQRVNDQVIDNNTIQLSQNGSITPQLYAQIRNINDKVEGYIPYFYIQSIYEKEVEVKMDNTDDINVFKITVTNPNDHPIDTFRLVTENQNFTVIQYNHHEYVNVSIDPFNNPSYPVPFFLEYIDKSLQLIWIRYRINAYETATLYLSDNQYNTVEYSNGYNTFTLWYDEFTQSNEIDKFQQVNYNEEFYGVTSTIGENITFSQTTNGLYIDGIGSHDIVTNEFGQQYGWFGKQLLLDDTYNNVVVGWGVKIDNNQYQNLNSDDDGWSIGLSISDKQKNYYSEYEIINNDSKNTILSISDKSQITTRIQNDCEFDILRIDEVKMNSTLIIYTSKRNNKMHLTYDICKYHPISYYTDKIIKDDIPIITVKYELEDKYQNIKDKYVKIINKEIDNRIVEYRNYNYNEIKPPFNTYTNDTLVQLKDVIELKVIEQILKDGSDKIDSSIQLKFITVDEVLSHLEDEKILTINVDNPFEFNYLNDNQQNYVFPVFTQNTFINLYLKINRDIYNQGEMEFEWSYRVSDTTPTGIITYYNGIPVWDNFNVTYSTVNLFNEQIQYKYIQPLLTITTKS